MTEGVERPVPETPPGWSPATVHRRVLPAQGALSAGVQPVATWQGHRPAASLPHGMGSLIKKRRKRMRKKKHKKMLKATRWQRRAAGK